MTSLHVTNASAAFETSICGVDRSCWRMILTKGERRKKHGLFRLTLPAWFQTIEESMIRLPNDSLSVSKGHEGQSHGVGGRGC